MDELSQTAPPKSRIPIRFIISHIICFIHRFIAAEELQYYSIRIELSPFKTMENERVEPVGDELDFFTFL